MWDDILGHEQNKEFLARLLQPGNRPHALLFYGPEGIGKKQLALRFAKTFLCQNIVPHRHPFLAYPLSKASNSLIRQPRTLS